MSWDQVMGNLKQLDGTLQEDWGMLVGSDDDMIEGWLERTQGILECHFADTKERVEEQLSRMNQA